MIIAGRLLNSQIKVICLIKMLELHKVYVYHLERTILNFGKN